MSMPDRIKCNLISFIVWGGWVPLLAWKLGFFSYFGLYHSAYGGISKPALMTLQTLKAYYFDTSSDYERDFFQIVFWTIIVFLVVSFFLNKYKDKIVQKYVKNINDIDLSRENIIVKTHFNEDGQLEYETTDIFDKSKIPD